MINDEVVSNLKIKNLLFYILVIKDKKLPATRKKDKLKISQEKVKKILTEKYEML
jgi:hypothetical protein